MIRTPRIADGDHPAVLHGVDVVATERIADLLAEFPASFPRRICTTTARHYCDAQPDPAQHYAARWAVIEAVRKLPDEVADSIGATDVAIERREDGPHLSLESTAAAAIEGTLRRRAEGPVPPWDAALSLSHDQAAGVAMGSVTVFAPALERDT